MFPKQGEAALAFDDSFSVASTIGGSPVAVALGLLVATFAMMLEHVMKRIKTVQSIDVVDFFEEWLK